MHVHGRVVVSEGFRVTARFTCITASPLTQPLVAKCVFGHALYSLHTDNIFTTRHLYHHDQGMYWNQFFSYDSYSMLLDLEYEEERGCSGKEEAEDECCSDSSAKRLRFMAFT